MKDVDLAKAFIEFKSMNKEEQDKFLAAAVIKVREDLNTIDEALQSLCNLCSDNGFHNCEDDLWTASSSILKVIEDLECRTIPPLS